jgi:methionyl aminopeptidase
LSWKKRVIEIIKKRNAKPAFKNFKPFGGRKYPFALCVSINEEVVHGLPSNRKLKNGDIVGLDFGVYYKGYYTDMAKTVGVGEISKQDENLINVTRKSLEEAISFTHAGIRLGDLGQEIQKNVEENKYEVIRDCVGHGVGKNIHEEPSIPNYGQAGTGPVLKEGMTLAIEPMASAGTYEVITKDDGWTIVTADGSRSAHFEHTIAVTNNGSAILTIP